MHAGQLHLLSGMLAIASRLTAAFAQAYVLQNPQTFANVQLTGPPTITMYSATSSASCTGSHHFAHWCNTSISQGGIIAIIVVGSLFLLALLIAIPMGLLALARSRRNRR